jgi:hypothetical protein
VGDCLNNPARPFPELGASDEVLTHHVRKHAMANGCWDGVRLTKQCPCGRAAVFTCVACGDALLLLTRNNEPPCEHAREAWAEMGVEL